MVAAAKSDEKVKALIEGIQADLGGRVETRGHGWTDYDQ